MAERDVEEALAAGRTSLRSADPAVLGRRSEADSVAIIARRSKGALREGISKARGPHEARTHLVCSGAADDQG